MTPPVPKLKIIVRRLPPGLTREEFMSTLGSEWDVGQGKVDWAAFKPGKISKDPSKPSRPARAYLHLTDESHISALADAVRKSTFEDAQTTFCNQCSLGPPTVEYAPFGYIPSNKIRVDARAGTIDQDPEFMAFLEGLANPTKELNSETPVDTYPKQEKVTTTPLVQYLREKKANKNKEVAVKTFKKQEIQSFKGKNVKDSNHSPDSNKRCRDNKGTRISSKAAKEAVKILNREAASRTPTTPLKSTTPSGSEKSSSRTDVDKLTSARQRGAAMAAHIRMLHRDLGISPAQSNRQGNRETNDALKVEKATVNDERSSTKDTEPQPTQNIVIPTAPRGKLNTPNHRKIRGRAHSNVPDYSISTSAAASRPPTPVVFFKKTEAPAKAHLTSSTDTIFPPTKPRRAGPSKKSQIVAPAEGVVQAFVKHANPSQGITEPLLKEAMEKFGEVSGVEVDRRKGFAYVDFIDTEGLKKAIAASPIPIAQGAIQVMPRKVTASHSDKKTIHQAPQAPLRGGRGGRGGSLGRAGRTGSKDGMNNISNISTELRKHPTNSPTEVAKK